MARRYNLEDLRAKCDSDYGNIGMGRNQLRFVFSHLDRAEAQRAILIEELIQDQRCPDNGGACLTGKRGLWNGREPDKRCVACWLAWLDQEVEHRAKGVPHVTSA